MESLVLEKKQGTPTRLRSIMKLRSYIMKHLIETHLKQLSTQKLVLSYLHMIPDPEIRSEVMNEIGSKKSYFRSNNDHRLFLLSIPNKDLAWFAFEKFATNPHHFSSPKQRKQYIDQTTDSSSRIRLLRRLIREHKKAGKPFQYLENQILQVKKKHNAKREQYGMSPLYRKNPKIISLLDVFF